MAKKKPPRLCHNHRNSDTYEDKPTWSFSRRTSALLSFSLRLWIGAQQIHGRTCGSEWSFKRLLWLRQMCRACSHICGGVLGFNPQMCGRKR